MPGSITHTSWPARVARAVALAFTLICCVPVCAAAATGLKIVSYHGMKMAVPRSWPVYDLARNPATCVRFDRHAVYLGVPGSDERCPAHAVGRTEAILLRPVSAEAASAGGAAAGPTGGSSGTLVNRAHGVVVTATWSANPAIIRRALGLRSLSELSTAGVSPSARTDARAASLRAHASAAVIPGGIYTGPGFDVCSTPSYSQMSAWGSASYHAIGVYIGGTNMACAQPNLSAAWVSWESGAGWHLIPIYVGLQAPSNSCGCAAISRGDAASQGRAAALDAVSRAQALGMGPGNPVYFDMEAYARGAANSPAVLAFIQAWTAQLHAEGYKSGVYGNADSGISDLVSEWGTSYTEPDEIWIANWNEVRSTNDPNVPAAEWAAHQRLHQYDGGHNESHGGVTLNVDGDYLDAATAAAGSAASEAADPSAISPPMISGEPLQGQTLTESHATWSGAPTSFTYQWEDCNTTGTSCVPIRGATGQSYALGASDIGHEIRVSEMASNAGGTGEPAASHPTTQVLSLVPLYWLYTAYGNVYPSPGTVSYGSPARGGFRGSSIAAMAASAGGRGYWLLTAAGRVFAYGGAARLPTPAHAHPIKGIVAAPGGGYWLYTASGNVYRTAGTAWFGSPSSSGSRSSSIAGMATTPDGNGYWLVSAAGRVFAYGDALSYAAPRHAHPIIGIVAAPGGGYWLYTAYGNLDPSPGTAWYGSPAARGFRGSSIVGMTATPDGRGYWLVDAAGRVFAYGDAGTYAGPRHPHPITGIAGG